MKEIFISIYAIFFVFCLPLYGVFYFEELCLVNDQEIKEPTTEKTYSTQEVMTMAVYQTYHMRCCAKCTNISFPGCEESRGVADAILNHNLVNERFIIVGETK